MKISNTIIQELKNAAGAENVRTDELMKLHTTMEVGGPASCFITPSDAQQIADVVHILKRNDIPFYILGNGSNVIFRDEGFSGAVINLTQHFTGYTITEENPEEVIVCVKAGTLNKDFAGDMTDKGLAGFEFASGIPGSIGGATVMNAGAYDGELRNIVKAVTLMDQDGNIFRKTNEEMDFGYRHSLAGEKGYIVLETLLSLRKDDPEKIAARVDELTRRRQEKQPLDLPSCGSTFKRPTGYFAGKLISDAGLKGFRHGGAQVSEKHAGFIVNADNASAREILELIEIVKQKVYESQGVRLECEVKII